MDLDVLLVDYFLNTALAVRVGRSGSWCVELLGWGELGSWCAERLS